MKFLLACGLLLMGATPLMAEEYDLPRDERSPLPAINYDEFTDEEKDYLNSIWVYQDVNNACGATEGKCQFYLSSTYTTEGADGQVLDNLVNGTVMRARKKFNELMEIMINEDLDLLKKVVQLNKLINEHNSNQNEDSDAVRAARNLDISEMNQEINAALTSRYSEDKIKLYKNTLIRIYQYAGIDVTTNPTDDDMRVYMRELIGAEAAIVSIRVKRGFDIFQARTLKKYIAALRLENPRAEIFLFGNTGDITITPNRITTTASDKDAYEQGGQTGGLFSAGSMSMGIDGGVITFSMTFDGFEALERRAKASGKVKKSWAAPIKFSQTNTYKIPVQGVANCKFNRNLELAAAVEGHSESGELIVPKIEFNTICADENKGEDGQCQTAFTDCSIDNSAYLTAEQKELLTTKMDEEIARVSKWEDKSLQLKEAFFNKIISDANALRDADLPYETKTEIIRLREDECFTVMTKRLGFGVSAFGFSVGFAGGSKEEVECVEKFRDLLHTVRVPIPVHVVANSTFSDIMNRTYNYTFDGFTDLDKVISFKNEVCVTLSSDLGSPDVLSGDKCAPENQAKAEVRNSLEGNKGTGPLKRLEDLLNTDGNV